ncbi:MAG: OmpA family protein [Salinivirgaceae bacterium]|jgi:outer membrane protein OmpA-like peptidoglycan-associated protein|nr:OmpA family protein [Salinivirgaceae bacterium]
MRILIIGFIVFVIWSIFSIWLYVEKLKPAMDDLIAVQSTSEVQTTLKDSVIQTTLTDSVIQTKVLIPNNLMIYFDFDDARFKNDSQIDNSVIEFKKWLDKNPESILSIAGHTDNIGTMEYNQILGLERVKAVQKYFQSKGIDATKIMADSKGESQPINDQTTEEGRAKNRRVVITIKN